MKSARLFGVTFALSLAILCSVGAILLLLPKQNKPAVSSTAVSSYRPDPEDNLSLLVIGEETGENDGLFFTLLRFDAENKRLTLAGLPPDTEINFGVETATLNRHYQQGGGRAAIRAVRQALRVSVDRYAVVDGEDLMVFADRLGGVTFQLDRAMVNDSINLQPGRQTLDGRRFRDAILFDADYQLDMALVKALIEQRVFTLSPDAADSLVEQMFNRLETNLSAYDYESRKSALSAWAKAEDNLRIFTLQGVRDDAGEMFSLSPESVELFRREVYGLEGDL